MVSGRKRVATLALVVHGALLCCLPFRKANCFPMARYIVHLRLALVVGWGPAPSPGFGSARAGH